MSGCQHNHSHPLPTYQRAFAIAIIANSLFVLCQIIFAEIANSTSLLADAVHNLGDVFSLIVAWIGNRLLKRQPTAKATFGLKKASILAALTNVILLVFTCGIIVYEAISKFWHPAPVETGFVMLVAGVGIVVNAATAMLFARESADLNIRAAFLHLVYDALVSVGVVLAAALLYWTGWLWLDPLVGLGIAALVLHGSWRLFMDSLRLLLDGVPRGISVNAIHTMLCALPGVEDVHDLHIWALSTQENSLSVHLLMPDERKTLTDAARQALSQQLKQDFNIHHVTIQIERMPDSCADACLRYL